MRYLGGKFRQSKAIANYVKQEGFSPKTYHEPFCGALSSAMAVSKVLPGVPVVLSDANPYLITMWKAGQDGWTPPKEVTENDHREYKEKRPVDDPMTAYLGFACSFGGQFFGVPARANGKMVPSYTNTVKKILWTREHDVQFHCRPYWEHNSEADDLTYLDPPYMGGHVQSRRQDVPPFNRSHFVAYAESLEGAVISSEFQNDAGWEVVHNWGDTINKRWGAATTNKAGVELLMRVK